MKFVEFQKIPRLNRGMVVTEKLDGTNAQVFIVPEHELISNTEDFIGFENYLLAQKDDLYMFAGSRNRWLNCKNDNYGFANWVSQNSEELFKLGIGHHYGEYWGNGIQRNYGLSEKKFSLFNTGRWTNLPEGTTLPLCCSVVPVIYSGPFDNDIIENIIQDLNNHGSVAVPGWMNPEGVVVFHVASRNLYKITCKNDESPKGIVNEV